MLLKLRALPRWSWLTLASCAVAGVAMLADIWTTLDAYHMGIVDANPVTRAIIARMTLDGWAALRYILLAPLFVMVVIVPHLLPARIRASYALVASGCAVALALALALIVTRNLAALALLP